MDIKQYIQDTIDTKTKILNDENILSAVKNIASQIVNAYKNEKKS